MFLFTKTYDIIVFMFKKCININFIKWKENNYKDMDRFEQTKKAGLLGIAGNLFLLIIKGTARFYV